MSTDPYTDPTTGVLRNRLGIADQAELQKAESDIARNVAAAIGQRHLSGAYDLIHLRAFHRELFGHVYPWAGEVRTVAISKGDMFCLPAYIESFAADIFGGLAKEHHLRGLDRPAFVERLTFYFGEVNALHPFREGNGRTQRAFFRQLAGDAGFALQWNHLDGAENITASVAIMRGDPEPMRRLLDQQIRW